MMAQPSGAPVFPPFSVISPQFVTQEPLEIIVDSYPGRNLVISNINHKIMLKVQPCDTFTHYQSVLLDVNDKPIAMLQKQLSSTHSRWNVFKGESKSDSDMIFTAKNENMIQLKTNISMMLANKMRSNDVCDLRIKGSWSKGNFTIYRGNSSSEMARIHKPQSKKKYEAADKFTVTIQPNMDYACVVALLAIVDANEHPDDNTAMYTAAAKGSLSSARNIGDFLQV
ncbi:putative tubby-like protein [Helianthus annuus]|uniref:Putative tubby C-terminal-like domain-containing protein n=1 Tax=Helianthus annuus TaxID=4232 RepID=A0A251SWB1_HELAN|nr:protein LURP-one-related 10 [Helianthus annuus]KAF5775219.1 putative tubby-like protein [Helianthus annuus]KAJ0478403.1 putative tubby-like protein [Helianthus annuus]KAJ0483156.1 putative tubby-like protein [Helianthus annuus]KAJ0499292.1 putative tubby-like protein [Helianthus annuus]KAJ0665311.1 putative tubby-like protein [Helianthus annuus]